MPFCKRDDAEIYFEEYGSGFPVLLFSPGGMWSTIEKWSGELDGKPRPVHDWTKVLAENFHVIAMDQRNAGQSIGSIEMDHGWDTYTRDQLAIMDQLGFDKFHTLGACIGGTYCLNNRQISAGAGLFRRATKSHRDAPGSPRIFPRYGRKMGGRTHV